MAVLTKGLGDRILRDGRRVLVRDKRIGSAQERPLSEMQRNRLEHISAQLHETHETIHPFDLLTDSRGVERAKNIRMLCDQMDEQDLFDLADEYPDIVGNTDGFPPKARYRANQHQVAEALKQPELSERMVSTLTALQDAQVLRFETDGSGRAVTVFGDMENSDHVSVWVPGMGSRLESFGRTHSKVHKLHRRAQQLAGSTETVTMVAWHGYEAPRKPPSLDVLSDRFARKGGDQLNEFMESMEWKPGAHKTAIGFSYGSTVVASALEETLEVDNAIMVGSPGMLTSHTDDFKKPDTMFYSMAASTDFVTWAERLGDRYGMDPSNSDSGCVRLDAGETVGHMSYLQDMEAQRNLAAIIVNRPELATRHEPHDWREELREHATEFVGKLRELRDNGVSTNPGTLETI